MKGKHLHVTIASVICGFRYHGIIPFNFEAISGFHIIVIIIISVGITDRHSFDLIKSKINFSSQKK